MPDAIVDEGRREIRRRTSVVLAVVALLAVPAGTLRALCLGHGCDEKQRAALEVPFCGLPDDLRRALSNGFREGRSPEVIAVARKQGVSGGTAFAPGEGPAWPAVDRAARGRVPVVLWGNRVNPGEIRSPVRLDAIAPTLAQIAGVQRPHPEVRSGRVLADAIGAGAPPRLVVVIALKGIGSAEMAVMPHLKRLARHGAATAAADPGALPLDPAAVLTTIGTGGLPHQHGIVGSLLRNDAGELVRAWGRGAPVSVIATLADDLDFLERNRPRIGLVAPRETDRGLVGDRWYPGDDRDDIEIVAGGPAMQGRAARSILERGFARDAVTDLLAVALEGPPAAVDRALSQIVGAARTAAGDAVTVALAGTGSLQAGTVDARAVRRGLSAAPPDAIAALSPGGIFVDQNVIADGGVSYDAIAAALLRLRDGRMFADAFAGIAISLGRYC